MTDNPRQQAVVQALASIDPEVSRAMQHVLDEAAFLAIEAVDHYDTGVMLARLQTHIQIPLPHIVSDEPKDQFDYLVEVVEGALKARILTALVNRASDTEPTLTEESVRHLVMVTR